MVKTISFSMGGEKSAPSFQVLALFFSLHLHDDSADLVFGNQSSLRETRTRTSNAKRNRGIRVDHRSRNHEQFDPRRRSGENSQKTHRASIFPVR